MTLASAFTVLSATLPNQFYHILPPLRNYLLLYTNLLLVSSFHTERPGDNRPTTSHRV